MKPTNRIGNKNKSKETQNGVSFAFYLSKRNEEARRITRGDN